VSSITLSDRASWLDNVQELASELNAYRQGVCRVQSVDPSERPDLFKQNELIINATSAGMAPNTDTTPFDTSLLESRHVVCDVVYVPHETKLLRDAGALGCKTLPGYWMMIWQGVEAFRRWMQERKPAIEPDVEVMTSTVLKSLTNRE
jgi:shikimate dehydrogenase